MAEVIIRSRIQKGGSVVDDVLVPSWVTEWEHIIFAKTMAAAKAVATKYIKKQVWLDDPDIPSHIVTYPRSDRLVYMDIEPRKFTFRGERWNGIVERGWQPT